MASTSPAPPCLAKANRVKTERARLKRMIAAGTVSFGEALEEPALQSMLLFDLLLALPARGSKLLVQERPTLLATTMFAHVQRGPLTRVEQLTDREKAILRYAWWQYQEGNR